VTTIPSLTAGFSSAVSFIPNQIVGTGGGFTVSQPISRDGNTIVGTQTGISDIAFYCTGTCTTVTQLLPSIIGGRAAALGVNANGTVIVGTAQGAGPVWDPVVWSPINAAAIVLPRPSGLVGAGSAHAVNDAGTVAAGIVAVTAGGLPNAVIWTNTGPGTYAATNIHDPLTLGNASEALAISGSGTVVGGFSSSGAFRWSAATGSQTIEQILATAGVTLPPNTVLGSVTGISQNGEIFAISGADTLTDTPLALVARYIAPVDPGTPPVTPPVTPPAAPPPTPIVGITSRDSVQRSFDRLAETRGSQMVTTRVMASVLLGINEQVNCGDCFSGFGSVGSFSAGLHGRKSLTDSVIAMGGVSFNQSQGKGYRTESSPTFALQLRVDPADQGPARPFLDIGGVFAPNAITKYSRRYENGASPALGRAGSSSTTTSVFGRLGYVWRISKEQEAAAYGELSQMWQRVKGYQEPLSQANPFEATVRNGTDRMTVAKVGGQFTQLLGMRWELNLSGGVAHGFNRKAQAAGLVPGFGLVAAKTPASVTWGEYGARLSYRISQGFVIDGFVNGTVSGERSVGNTIHGGFGIRMSF
jgi:hypothetical protein